MRLPKDGSAISISGQDYTLRYVKDLKGGEDNPLWGHYKVHTREILIDAGQPELSKRDTLLHEVVHGILEHAGIEQSERLANAISYGLESVRINGKPLIR